MARSHCPLLICLFLCGNLPEMARGALVAGTQKEIRTGSLSDGFPDFVGSAFRSGSVAGTTRAANFFGSTSTLTLPDAGTLPVSGMGVSGLAWLKPSTGTLAPSTANSGSTLAFTTSVDITGRNRIANTGFHGTNGWYLDLPGLVEGERWRVQLLCNEGFSGGTGRNFDILVDGVLAFDNFHPPALGEAPFSAIAGFEAVVDASGTIRILTAPGDPAVAADTNPYLTALAMTKVDTTPSAPVFARHPDGFSRLEGDPGRLTGEVSGFPAPALQWFRGADPVPDATGSTLDFPALALTDAGTYTLRAVNALGSALSAPATVTVSAQPAGLLRGLRGWWKFDETSGTGAADSSPYGNPGVLTNFPEDGTQWVAGRAGGALAFRGAAAKDFVRVNDYLLPGGPVTVSAWAWADARPAWASIAKTWNSPLLFQFGLDSSTGRLSDYVTAASGQLFARDPVVFPLGSWQHTAFTADGATLRVYRNGVQVASTAYSQSLVPPLSGHLGIGARLNAAGTAADTATPGYWQGKLDDVAVWSRALSIGEINAIYDGGLQGQNLAEIDVTPPSGGIVITEFLASNAGGLRDEDLDSPDWIELYNGTGVPVNLDGWFLTDSADDLRKWPFPATVIGAGEFLLVYASEKDRAIAGRPLHTNFKLSTAGEYLALVKPDLTIASAYAPLFPPQLANVSYGLVRPPTEGEVPGSEAFAALTRYYQIPTPGALNGGGLAVPGPLVTGLTHAPAVPADDDTLTVRADVVPAFQPVTGVDMTYRVNFGTPVTVPMTETSAGSWSAEIPASASAPGQMVRYFILATDAAGGTSRWPQFFDAARQPEYQGTVVADPAITSALPVFHWWVQNTSAPETVTGTRCSLFYDGQFYDNIYCRMRGGTSAGWPKKSYKLEFNDGYPFQLRPGHRVDEFDLNTTYTDKSYNRAVLHYELNRDAGLPSPETFHIQLRRNGLFYSVTLYTEQPDGDFLRRTGLDPDGALYKGGPGANGDSLTGYEKKTRDYEGTSDLQALLSGVAQTGTTLERFVFDNVDVPAEVNFMACMAVAQNIDGTDKNHFLYRDTGGTREWRTLPWDLDLSFGPNALNTDTIVYNQQNVSSPQAPSHPFIGARPWLLHSGKYHRLLEAIVNTPRTRTMLLRRVRSLTDEFLGTSYFTSRLDALVPMLDPDVTADKARWGPNAAFSGATYTLLAANNRIRNEYLNRRPGYLQGATINGVLTANPDAQSPDAVVDFGTVVADPGTGTQEEEYFTLVNPGTTAVDVSGWAISGQVDWTLKPGTVLLPGETLYLTPHAVAFRARLASPRGNEALFVQGNYPGQLSARGGFLTLANRSGAVVATRTYSGTPSPAQAWLRITEIMYNAPGSDDAEFLELKNTGPVPVPLQGVRFTEGIAFEWTDPAAVLAPGASLVLVRDPVAFAAAWPGVGIGGVWEGSLSNSGERLQLVDAAGENILDFDYEDDWYPATDGRGCSLVSVDESAAPGAWDGKGNWRASHVYRGTPGSADPLTPQDSDADGQDDGFEALFGSDPLRAASRFEVSVTPAPGISFPAAAGIPYQLQESEDLITWMPHTTTGPLPSARVVSIPVQIPPGARRYYRIRVDPPAP